MRAKKVVREFFYSAELQALSGLSKHMVDYLCRHGLIVPSVSLKERRHGKRRLFAFTDILVARSIAALLAAGVSVLSLRKAFLTLRDDLDLKNAVRLTDKRIIIRDGIPLLLEPNQPPVDLTTGGQMVFSFVLEVEATRKRADSLWTRREAIVKKRLKRAQDLRQRKLG